MFIHLHIPSYIFKYFHHIFIESSSNLHHIFIISSYIFLISSSQPHHVFTISSSYFHHIFITSSPYLHHIFTISSSYLHIFSPYLHHIFTIFSSFLHHILIISSSNLDISVYIFIYLFISSYVFTYLHISFKSSISSYIYLHTFSYISFIFISHIFMSSSFFSLVFLFLSSFCFLNHAIDFKCHRWITIQCFLYLSQSRFWVAWCFKIFVTSGCWRIKKKWLPPFGSFSPHLRVGFLFFVANPPVVRPPRPPTASPHMYSSHVRFILTHVRISHHITHTFSHTILITSCSYMYSSNIHPDTHVVTHLAHIHIMHTSSDTRGSCLCGSRFPSL